MKTIFQYLTLFLLVLHSVACSDDDDRAPIDQLPPVTQTGEQTFGCLINGEAFIPIRSGGGRPRAFYQFVNGAFTLGISASNGNAGPNFESVALAGIDVDMLTEKTYILIEEESGKFSGRYSIGGGLTIRTVTSSNDPGTLTITKFDQENGIIAGTFEFTALDNDGNEINITNGRFDMRYTN